jgi:hypothetical protein
MVSFGVNSLKRGDFCPSTVCADDRGKRPVGGKGHMHQVLVCDPLLFWD